MHSIARIGTSSHGRRTDQEFFRLNRQEPCVGETLPQANAMVSNTRSCSKTGLAYSRFFFTSFAASDLPFPVSAGRRAFIYVPPGAIRWFLRSYTDPRREAQTDQEM